MSPIQLTSAYLRSGNTPVKRVLEIKRANYRDCKGLLTRSHFARAASLNAVPKSVIFTRSERKVRHLRPRKKQTANLPYQSGKNRNGTA
jgi:hypothetical protein